MGCFGLCAPSWAWSVLLRGLRLTHQTPLSLSKALAVIKSHQFVDLTHSFAPGIPHWKGAPNERVKTLYTVQKDGFRINEYCHVGQWGTHVDPPAHFHTGLHRLTRLIRKRC